MVQGSEQLLLQDKCSTKGLVANSNKACSTHLAQDL